MVAGLPYKIAVNYINKQLKGQKKPNLFLIQK